MTLALTLGMSVGYRRTLWMMIGELAGVALVSVSAVLGIAAVMLNYPWLFTVLKFAGGAYLLYLGIEMWRSRANSRSIWRAQLHHLKVTGIWFCRASLPPSRTLKVGHL